MQPTPWDVLQTFAFEGQDVRGALVTLGPSWREALARRRAPDDGGHAWPEAVRHGLGELAAASLLLQTGLKFDGALVIQIQGGGPVRLAVAEAHTEGRFRVSATLNEALALPVQDPSASLAALVDPDGRARCAITLDADQRRRDQPPQQGIVALRDGHGVPFGRLQDVLMHHMGQSAQLETWLRLEADDDTASGLLLQRLPSTGGTRAARGDATQHAADGEPAFARLSMLAETLSRSELLTLAPADVLRRLFWQEDVRVFEPKPMRFACRCSRARVAAMLRALGQDEVMGLVDERGAAEIGCDFCGANYRFDAVDAQALFRAAFGEGEARH